MSMNPDKIPDRLLEMVPDRFLAVIQSIDPSFPLASSDCVVWQLSHPNNCTGCQHFQRCFALVVGLTCARQEMEDNLDDVKRMQKHLGDMIEDSEKMQNELRNRLNDH